MLEVPCQICKTVLYVKPSHQKLGYGKYCSRKCKELSQRKGKYVICHQCGKEVWKMPKALKHSKSKKYFCSKSCQTTRRNGVFSGPKHPNWQGGEYIYPKVMKQHGIPPVCKKCRLKDKRVLIIHHIDHNRKHNTIDNLMWLCRNCHYLIHDGKTV